jgi:hypothetical protein
LYYEKLRRPTVKKAKRWRRKGLIEVKRTKKIPEGEE